ncbi:MAG TPA: hypothetical protein VGG48_14130 [Rhizomicrobium sp.]|jgi:hypothetical protein
MNAPIAPLHVEDNPVLSFLLASQSLIRLTRGEKRATLLKHWVRAATWSAHGLLGHDETLIPQSKQAAFRMLFASCIELGESIGIPRPEMVEAFNIRAESGSAHLLGEVNAPVDRMFAALLILLAELRKAG